MPFLRRVAAAHRYLDARSWWAALSLSWLHIFTGCILVWITSNGIDATAQQCPLEWVREACAGTGTSWKSAIVQAAVHATYKVIVYINRNTPTRRRP
jgi:hypothetical protein